MDARWRRTSNVYFQRIAPGDPVSILCSGQWTPKRTSLGPSRQWAAPAPGEPFRFGGSLRPADLSPGDGRQLGGARGSRHAAACGLLGLNSIDFLVEGEAFTLIEINPRPGATLDIFEDCGGALFQAHVDACRAACPQRPLEFEGAAAAAIAYARRDIPAMPAFDWPDWTAGPAESAKPQCARMIRLCTIKARAAEPARARALWRSATHWLLGQLDHIQNRTATCGRERHIEQSDMS